MFAIGAEIPREKAHEKIPRRFPTWGTHRPARTSGASSILFEPSDTRVDSHELRKTFLEFSKRYSWRDLKCLHRSDSSNHGADVSRRLAEAKREVEIPHSKVIPF